MRWKAFAVGVAGSLLLASSARAGWGVVVGNDTGGIIPWSPENHVLARAIASDHCGRYFKYARITSVHPRYGDYIAFVCRFPRHYDPVAAAALVVVSTAPVVSATSPIMMEPARRKPRKWRLRVRY